MSTNLTVRLDDITPSPTNPRKTFDEAALAAMAETIKDVGVMTPVLLRTHPRTAAGDIGYPGYELIAGERRWRASGIAGRPDIPAILRDDLDDATIVKLQLIENLQREDLHPLEEAEGYRQMMTDHGYTAEALGAEIGKSRSYIFGQLKLLDLCDDAQRLFRAGTINASIALLIARIPTVPLQQKALEDVTRKDYSGDRMSVRAAAQHIQNRYMTRLKNAPFPGGVEGVGGMGTCAACPKRTGNAPELYADVDDPDVCTDPDCFAIKRTAEAVRQAADLGDKVPVLTGIDAQQAMPTYSTETRSHARLDDICTNDPERRTYREIMGDDTEGVALVQHEEKFIPIVQKKVITEKLRQEGAVTESQKQRAEARKEKQKLEIANVWRDRVFRLTRDLAAAEVKEDGISPLLPDVMPIIAHTFLRLAGHDKGGQVAGLWGALGMDNYTRQQAYLLQLPTLKPEELLLICLDLALIGDCHTDNHNTVPELLLTVARALEVDPDAELKKVQLEFAEAEEKKKGKTAKNRPAPSSTESTSTPQTAALAGNNTEGESATVEGQNSAPPEAASGKTGEEEQSSAADAAVEKQSGGDYFPPEIQADIDRLNSLTPKFNEGDFVKVTKAHNSTLIGKRGIVNSVYVKGYQVRLDRIGLMTFEEDQIEAMINEDVFKIGDRVKFTAGHVREGQEGEIKTDWANGSWLVDIGERRVQAFAEDLEKAPSPDGAVIETDEKQSSNDVFFGVGDRVKYIGDTSLLVGCEGTITSPFLNGEYHVQFDTILGEIRVRPDRIQLIAKSPAPAGAVIEMDEKPSEAGGMSPKVGECIKVRSTAKNWKIAGNLVLVLSTPKADRASYIVKFGEGIGDMGEIFQDEIAEIVGKPVLAWMKDPVDAPAPLKVGDRVKVKEDAKGANGIKRKCAGKEGSIEAARGDIFAVRFAPGRSGVVANLQADELIKLPSPVMIIASDFKIPKAPLKVMYRHPEHRELEWSGRGKKPKWVEVWLQTPSQTLEQLLPAEQAQGAEA